MDQIESPTSSDSAHTPLQDEHIACDISAKLPMIIDLGETVDMIEEQLDYEEFIENNEENKPVSEVEEGEYNSGDDNVVVINDNEDKKSLENGEINSDDDVTIVVKPAIKASINEVMGDDHILKCDGELAEGELKAEEEEMPLEETPWERGLRLARERRELAKLKKVQEKDTLKEKQLHINLDNVEEVEPISKPQTEKNYEMNQQLLKAMQPIVILPEEPRNNEMILEYYLAESDYQHRPRFIPSRLYTLDPWEVEEWKRELDMMKLENEIGRIASNKHKRLSGGNQQKRMGRRGSVSSSVSSRSSSVSAGKPAFNQSNRQYELQTSQYALSRSKPNLDKHDKSIIFNESPNKVHHLHRGKRDLPPEFKNRIVSSSRSSSRSSSGSHSSSSGSSSTSRSTSSPRKHRAVHAKPKPTALPTTTATAKKSAVPMYRTIKKPALGRARSDSSASSKSSDSSSTSSDTSSSQSSASSNDSKVKSKKSNKTDKQFINSWFTKTPQNQLEATIVPDSSAVGRAGGIKAIGNAELVQMNGDIDGAADEGLTNQLALPSDASGSQLLSAGTRPGVKLKLVSRPKPVILPNQTSGKSAFSKTTTSSKDKSNKKQSSPASVASKLADSSQVAPSSIFNNSKSIFSTVQSTVTGSSHKSIDQLSHTTKDTALKSNLAATQLEMQQEFLRNYKDKIAIYRSQLSYQQQNPLSGQHPSTLTHSQPPPIKGPITVMSVTSKKTGPPKTQVKVTDRYSQHEEHSRRYNHHYSPNYRSDYRDNAPFGNNRNRHGSRNRSRSFDNDRGNDWGGEKSKDARGPDREYHGRPGRNYDNNGGIGSRDYNDNGKFRQSENYRSNRNNDFGDNKFRDNNNRSSYNENSGKYRDQHDNRNDRNRYDAAPLSGGRHDVDRANRFDRNEDRPPRRDDRNNSGGNFNRNFKDSGSFSRDDRPRDRFRVADREFEDRLSDTNNNSDKRNDSDKHREEKFDNPKPRPRNLDRDSLTDPISATIDNNAISSKPAATLPPITVPKEKRREELLKQLKAVEDAIAKKKAKIDK